MLYRPTLSAAKTGVLARQKQRNSQYAIMYMKRKKHMQDSQRVTSMTGNTDQRTIQSIWDSKTVNRTDAVTTQTVSNARSQVSNHVRRSHQRCRQQSTGI